MKVERKQGLAWRKVGDETVVIHLARHRIFGFENSAAKIWEALAEPKELSALEAIAADDGTDTTNVIGAVNRFVADLVAEDLVTVSGEMPSGATGDNLVDFPSPRITWREELQRFAGACAQFAGQSPVCNQDPQNS